MVGEFGFPFAKIAQALRSRVRNLDLSPSLDR